MIDLMQRLLNFSGKCPGPPAVEFPVPEVHSPVDPKSIPEPKITAPCSSVSTCCW